MKKKCAIIYYNNLPIYVCEVKDVEPLDFLKIQKECKQNLSVLLAFEKDKIGKLENQIKNLEDEIKILKGEE